MSERWLQVPGFRRYEVSNLGHVRRICNIGRHCEDPIPSPQPIKPYRNKNGHLYVMTFHRGKKRNWLLSTLVRKAFGRIENGPIKFSAR